jgi:hypothetical protein
MEKETAKISSQPYAYPIGMAWYKQDQWEYLRQMSVDIDILEDTYEEWLEQAENKFIVMKRLGLEVYKIPIDMFELIKWCRDENRLVNGESRASYTGVLLRKSYPKIKYRE